MTALQHDCGVPADQARLTGYPDRAHNRWDPAYTPMIATHDRDQPPQSGGWLHARYGAGHYTYVAYAFHRQLPYGVPGAFRLLANLLSLGKK